MSSKKSFWRNDERGGGGEESEKVRGNRLPITQSYEKKETEKTKARINQ